MGLIHITIPSVAWPDFMHQCVNALLRQEGVDIEDLLIIANGPRTVDAAVDWQTRGASVAIYPKNLGCTGSWNLGGKTAFARGYTASLMIGDDVEIQDTTTVLRLVEAVREDPNRLISMQGLGFSGWVLTRAIWEKVGDMDEGFWPAYYEDNDYHRRIWLLGMGSVEVPSAYKHYGSGSLRKWKEWEDWNAMYAFNANGDRFRAKWGGMPNQPQQLWSEPWGGHPEFAMASTKDRLRATAPPPPWESEAEWRTK